MASYPIKCLVLVLALASLVQADDTLPFQGFFEQSSSDGQAWKTFGAGTHAVILPEGFILRSGDTVQRFRWDASMGLNRLEADELLGSSSYILAKPEGLQQALPHARRIRASNDTDSISVVYYFGPRGFEFDIEASPGTPLPEFALESLDGSLEIDANGDLRVDEQPLTLRPAAYSVDGRSGRHVVAAAYRSDGPNRISIEVGPHDRNQKLVVDPVLTHVSFFGGTADERPKALRELPDGSLLIAGWSKSFSIPGAESLNTQLLVPGGYEIPDSCFIARVSPREGRVHFVSYLWAMRCEHTDVDSVGRILLAGILFERSALSMADGQFTRQIGNDHSFLARVSADGRELEYATYLRAHNGYLAQMIAGPGETVYLAFGCPHSRSNCVEAFAPTGFDDTPRKGLFMRYNIAQRRYDAKTYLDGVEAIHGLELAPGGSLYAYGHASGQGELPLMNPVQSAPSIGNQSGFVSALSGDLTRLEFSTYLSGGRGAFLRYIIDVSANSDGSIWVTGNAPPGGLELEPVEPIDAQSAPFLLRVRPAEGRWDQAFWAGRGRNHVGEAIGALRLADGRFCAVLAGGNLINTLPGSVVSNVKSGSHSTALGCLNPTATAFDVYTQFGLGAISNPSPEDVLLAAADDGGVWSVSGRPEPRSYELESTPPQVISIRHVSLETPRRPILDRPKPVRISILRGETYEGITFGGRHFSHGTELDFDGQRIPLAMLGPLKAELFHKSEEWSGNGQVLDDLRPGTYEGHLVIPTEPEEIVSDSFPVHVSGLRPSVAPFQLTNTPNVLAVSEPVYTGSEVRWNGTRISLNVKANGEGGTAVIPSDLLSPGNSSAQLINPGPNGGRQTQLFFVQGSTILAGGGGSPNVVGLGGLNSAVNPSSKVLYVIAAERLSGLWKLVSYVLPSVEPNSEVSFNASGASNVVDLDVSADGKYVYLLDDRMRVTRFRTNPLAVDLQFGIPEDGYARLEYQYEWMMEPLLDAPESFVVKTHGGRLAIYDDDRRRTYTTTDFPPQSISDLEPLLATSSYVYARETYGTDNPRPGPPECIAKYPVDALGFAVPEQICDLDKVWGMYPEMIRLGDRLALSYDDRTVDVTENPNPQDLSWPSIDPVSALQTTSEEIRDSRGRFIGYRIRFRDLETSAVVGHYPRYGVLRGFLNEISIIDDQVLVFRETRDHLTNPPFTHVVRNWRDSTEWYDVSTAPVLRESSRPPTPSIRRDSRSTGTRPSRQGSSVR